MSRRLHPTLRRLPRIAMAAALLVVVQFAAAGVAWTAPAAAAPTGTGGVVLRVESARSVNVADPGAVKEHDAVTAYKWLITADDVGDPTDSTANCLPTRAGGTSAPGFADTCRWPSTRATPGAVPVVAHGDQTTLGETTAFGDLPPGKYLISVTADGYKIGGQHFAVTSGASTSVTVGLQPYPLPLGTVRIRVFEDTVPVDGTYEVGAEHGLAGFRATLADVFGVVSTDYYGNPLCTTYVHDKPGRLVFDAAGRPVVAAGSTGTCVSDVNGDVVIPNLGPNRYAAQLLAPTGRRWIQTTTLEGYHDWDIWTQEGDTGYDTEQTLGAEKVPAVDFGFVRPAALPAAAASGGLTGTVVRVDTYVGGTGGVNVPNAGVAGGAVRGPVPNAWIALSALGGGDGMIYAGQTDAKGHFDLPGVPAGDYQLTAWDEQQELILDSFTVSVRAGNVTDVGQKGLVGWFSDIRGTVFVDANANGRRDAGEAGVPRFPVAVKERDNSVMDQGTNTVTTDAAGNYTIREVYPLSKFLVLEAFNTRYHTTGITVQADNEPSPRTMLGAAVDLNVLPIIGLGGRVDWGVQPFAAGTNGGIAGTITYDTTRNELDPQYAATEAYQPGIPGLKVHLYAVARDAAGDPVVDPETGAYVRGPELNDAYTSETWDRSKGCQARLHSGAPLTDQLALPDGGPTADQACVEAPMLGWQAQPSDTTEGAFGQTVNGNYAFADSKISLYPPTDPRNPSHTPEGEPIPDGHTQPLPADDYLVGVEIPADASGEPMYKVTQEEDVNVFDGDAFLPQENFPPPPAQGANPPDGAGPVDPPTAPPTQGGGIWSGCAGAQHTVHVTDAAFVAAGGSPFEGQKRHLCDTKLVTVRNGQTVAPNFNLFTEVPLPTHFWGLTINDLGLTNDKRSIGYGEAEGLPGVPMGIYDFTGRLVDTVKTDFNGMYEAIEPSTSTYNCPLPAGPCPGMYRFVGNDPGQPGHLNADYNRRYRTIATNFQAWPGLYTVTDTAPTQVAVVAIAPGSTQVNPVHCDLGPSAPQLFSVSRPYVRRSDVERTVTIKGRGFGDTPGAVTLDDGAAGSPVAQAVVGWTDTSVTIEVKPTRSVAMPLLGVMAEGPASLAVTRADGQTTVNGLALQLLGRRAVGVGSPANPLLYQVNPPAPFRQTGAAAARDVSSNPDNLENDHAIQRAVDAAAAATTATRKTLVVVWPHSASRDNPHGSYFENVVLHAPVRLQGVGAGGFGPDGTYEPGSVLSGQGFSPDNDRGTAWFATVASIPHAGPANVPDAATVTVLAAPNAFDAGYRTEVNGFTITGAAQSDFGVALGTVNGAVRTPVGAPGATITQGGGVYLHAEARYTRITDNVIVGNSGSYGGGIRVGTPYASTGNTDVSVLRNQIRDNGGTNLAGGVGIFRGSDRYVVERNAVCGNFSAEYGGGISAYGRSPGGSINANRLWFNQSYDEGGGIMVAGEVPANPDTPSTGTGRVSITRNVVQANLANDDGGGIRLLQVGNFPVSIGNNTIAGNISTHEGGGIALDDAPAVTVVANTVMDNITTATAVTSTGAPAPAGLSTALNSAPLQRTLPAGWARYSKPTLVDNIFWNNRAGTWTGTYVAGIGAPDAPAGEALHHWDIGSTEALTAGVGGPMTPRYSVLQASDPGSVQVDGTDKVGRDPQIVNSFPTSVSILYSRTFPSFREATIVAQDVPPSLMGNYHLRADSGPAAGSGLPNSLTAPYVPTVDIDGDRRSATAPDIGSDEFR